jgi:hypothetical protein
MLQSGISTPIFTNAKFQNINDKTIDNIAQQPIALRQKPSMQFIYGKTF